MPRAAAPLEQSQGDVTYLTGGIGSAEAAAMRKAQARYPLSLEFVKRAKPRDEFLANVNVTIENRAGNAALATTSQGPFLLARLPEGKYTVRVEDDGKTKVRHVTLAARKPQHLVFEW